MPFTCCGGKGGVLVPFGKQKGWNTGLRRLAMEGLSSNEETQSLDERLLTSAIASTASRRVLITPN